MAGGKKHNGQKSSKIKSYHFIESKKARLTKGHSSRDLKGRTVKVRKCMGREKFWLEKGQVQRPWGRNMLGAGCAKSKARNLGQRRREARARRCLQRGRRGWGDRAPAQQLQEARRLP